MVIVKLYNQLGNQMMIYCAVKSLCLDYHHDFKFSPVTITNKKEINDYGKNHGRDIFTIFKSVNSELIETDKLETLVIDYYVEYRELIILLKKGIPNNKIVLVEHWGMTTETLMGHEHLISDWFCFPEDIELKCRNKIDSLHREFGKVISVHFRCGRDYVKGAYQLESRYWIDGAKKINELLNDNCFFLIFCDDENTFAVNRFKFHFSNRCLVSKGDLAEDLCLVSKCDGHIICNSTYSVIGSLLDNNKDHITIRPAKAPCGTGYMDDMMFLHANNWIIVGNGKRSIGAFIFKMLRMILRK